MAKSERELAFLRDLDLNANWTRRFTDMLDKHIGFEDVENILYMNAGTGDHSIAIRERVDERTSVFGRCESEELVRIARDKGAALRSDVDFSTIDFENDSFDMVLTDASLTRPAELAGLIGESVRAARPGGQVAVLTPSAGSFGEVFSLLWEVLFNEDLGEHGAAAEKMINDLPSVTRVEGLAADAGLVNVRTEIANEIFEYKNGAEFAAAPLIADFLMPAWLETLDENDKERVSQKLARLIDEEDGSLTFRFSVKATLLVGNKP